MLAIFLLYIPLELVLKIVSRFFQHFIYMKINCDREKAKSVSANINPHNRGVSLVSKKQNVTSLPTRADSVLWGASVLPLRPPGLECRILCLEGSVISDSSHRPQEVLLTHFSLYVYNYCGLKSNSFIHNFMPESRLADERRVAWLT